MNKISQKISTYYDLISLQKAEKSEKNTNIPNFTSSLESHPTSPHENYRNFLPEIFLYQPFPPQISSEIPPKITKAFSLEDNPKIINKEILKNLLLNCLEGFNSSLFLLEKKNEKSSISFSFFSLIFSYLNHLKKILMDFKRDGIISHSKVSFFAYKDEKFEDFMQEGKISIQNPSEISKKFFLEIEDISKFLANHVKSQEFERFANEESFFCFRNELFFTDSGDQLCWKAKFFVSGVFLKEKSTFSSYLGVLNEVFREISEEKEKSEKFEKSEKCEKCGKCEKCEKSEKWKKCEKCEKSEKYGKCEKCGKCEKYEESSEKAEFLRYFLKELCENTGFSVFFSSEKEDHEFQSFLQKMPIFSSLTLKIQRNGINEISDYLETIQTLQKTINMKDDDISNYKLTNFLKEKENDELKMSIAQLESNLLLYEDQKVSILNESSEKSSQIVSFHEDDHEEIHLNFYKKTEENFDEEIRENSSKKTKENSVILKKIEGNRGKNCENNEHNHKNSKNYVKSESLRDIAMNMMNSSKKMIEFTKIEGQEQMLEINYYEELSLLREKFHKTSKEMMKIKIENEKFQEIFEKNKQKDDKNEEILEEILEEKNKEILEEKNREILGLNKEKEQFALKILGYEEEILRYREKNRELQTELIDLYNVYYKKNFTKK